MRAYRYVIASLLVYSGLLLLAPIEPNFEVASRSIWLLGISTAMAVLGLRLAWSIGQPQRDNPTSFSIAQASRRANWIAVFGLVCTLIDRYVVRGANLDFDFLAARDALETTQPSPLGLIGALTGAMSYFAVGLTAARSLTDGPPGLKAWAASTAILLAYVGVSMILGSRSILLVTVVATMFSVLWLRRAFGRPMHLRYWAAGLIALMIVAAISAVVMLERLEQMGLDPMVSIEYSAYAYTIRPSDSATEWLSAREETAQIWVAGFSLVQYVFHGFYEFCVLAQGTVDHAGGEATFWLPLKLLRTVGLVDGAPIDLDNTEGWRNAVYTTFFGPLYLDFGAWIPAVSFVLCLVLGLPAARLRRDRLAMLPYCSILCALCVLFPIVSLLDSASGAYPLVASLFIPWLGRTRAVR